MRQFLLLVEGVTIKTYTLLKRYLVNTVSEVVMLYVFFAVVFFGGQQVTGPDLDGTLDGVIVGFFLLTMAAVAYEDVSWVVIREAQWGTLEQLYMSPAGFRRIVLVRMAIQIMVSFALGVVLLALMMVTSNRFLHVDVLTIVPVGVLAVLSAAGVGLVLSGAALVFKRLESVFQIVQFLFIGFIAAPVAQYPATKLLPLSLGSYLLRQSMGNGTRLWEFPAADLLLLFAIGAGYLLLGILAFELGKQEAQRRGVLGHY